MDKNGSIYDIKSKKALYAFLGVIAISLGPICYGIAAIINEYTGAIRPIVAPHDPVLVNQNPVLFWFMVIVMMIAGFGMAALGVASIIKRNNVIKASNNSSNRIGAKNAPPG